MESAEEILKWEEQVAEGNASDVAEIVEDSDEADLLKRIARAEGANGIYHYFDEHPATTAAYESSYVVAALIQQGIRTMGWHHICKLLGGDATEQRILWDVAPTPENMPVTTAAIEAAEAAVRKAGR